MLATIVLLSAVAVGTLAYRNYFNDILSKENRPNRWSWLIWSATGFVEAFTFEAITDDWTKSVPFFVSAISCVIVAIRIWRHAAWKWPTLAEVICIVASIIATVLWLYYNETMWAHVVALVAIPVSFIPTWIDAKKNPADEDSSAWWLWTIGDTLALTYILMRSDLLRPEEWMDKPYAIIELACHASMAIMVSALLIMKKFHARRV